MSKKKKVEDDSPEDVLTGEEVAKGEFLDSVPEEATPSAVLDNTSPTDAAFEEEVAKPEDPPIDDTPAPVEGAPARVVEQGTLDHMPTPDELESRLDCDVCQGTGAVPKTVIDGKTTEWKDCNACGGYQLDPRTGLRVNPMGLNNVR